MAIELDVYNLEGKKEAEKLSVSDAVFGAEVNRGLLHQTVLWFLANRRSGSANTKTRSEVRGSSQKMYQQKGTGRARRGTKKAPNLVGGGVAFGPKPRSFSFKLNKKARKSALKSALTNKLESIVVLKDLELKGSKTKEVVTVLKNFKEKATVLFVDTVLNDNFNLASRNIKDIKSIDVGGVNVYEITKYDKIYITKDAVKKLEESLA